MADDLDIEAMLDAPYRKVRLLSVLRAFRWFLLVSQRTTLERGPFGSLLVLTLLVFCILPPHTVLFWP